VARVTRMIRKQFVRRLGREAQSLRPQRFFIEQQRRPFVSRA
jgi:hypothetical protein